MRRGLGNWHGVAGLALGLATMAGCKNGSPTAPEEPPAETVTFEFSSDIRGTADVGAAIHAAVHSVFHLALDTSLPHDQTNRSYRGSGPLEWTAFSFDNPNPSECANPSFSTQASVLSANVALSSLFAGGPPAMLINMDPGHPLENVSLTCGGATATLYTTVPGFWETSFRALHASDVNGHAFRFNTEAASPSGPGFIVVKSYNRTIPASHGTLAEATTLIVTVGK